MQKNDFSIRFPIFSTFNAQLLITNLKNKSPMKKMFLLLGMLAISFLGFAQVSRQQAINSVLNSVVSNNVDSVNVYMEPLSQSDSYYKLSRYDSSLANKCDERLENYDEAIAWYEEVLTNPNTSFNDSIFAAIDLGDLYLRLDEGGEKGICGKMVQYKPKSVYMHNKQTNIALSMIPQKEAGEKECSDSSPVQNLELSVGSNDTVLLTWDLPSGSETNPMALSWLMNDSINDCAQLGYDSYMSNRYDALDLRTLIGWRIESISYFKTTNWTQSLCVWKQKQDEEMIELYSQEVPENASIGLLTILLDEDIVIEPNTQYWFALRAKWNQGQPQDSYSFGLSVHESGIDGKSNLAMMSGSNEWQAFYHYNFWIRACLVDAGNGKRALQNSKEISPLTGYRIYRDGQLIKEIPYSFVTYFTDTQFTKGIDVEYCVTAVYGDEESEPVCATATITGITEKPENDGITVSPNPTNGLVRIEGVEVAEMQVYNALGQLVKFAQNSNEINLKGLPQGVYSLRITGVKGEITSRKIVVE